MLVASSLAAAQEVAIDTFRSTVTVRVYKSGFFSHFAHDHRIKAPIASGTLDVERRSVALTFKTAEMQVADEEGSDSEHHEIEATMKSPKVLDVERFPTITFKSQSITNASEDHYQVKGELTLHGVSRQTSVPVRVEHGRYLGSATLKQTDYGIVPVKIAGGTVKVKDEIDLSFEIVPSIAASPARPGASQ
jgi:polyisoprenoid-binding protein YceI